MTSISRDTVLYLAQLSNITLTDDEIESLPKDIGEILTYVEKLNELDTDNVEPTYQIGELENVWRDDTEDMYGQSRDSLLAIAPDVQNNQIKVPKVL